MGAIIAVGEERVWMSTGSAEAVRHGLVAYLRERGEERTPLGARVVAALEHVWPADLADDLAPFDEPAARALLAPAWLALTRDVASPQPRLVREVRWERIDRSIRIVWIANLARISRAWSGTDLTGELTSEWPAHERNELEVSLAETAIMRAWGRFNASPTAELRAALEDALERQRALASDAGADVAQRIEAAHARIRRRADERAEDR